MIKWENKKLDELGFVGRGKSKHRPRDAAFLYGGKYPFIQTADVKNANLYINSYTQTYSDAGLAQSKLWGKGTLCITIAANIADTAILDIEACFPDSIIGFVPDEKLANAKFIKYYIDTFKQNLKQISQGAAQDNLNLKKLLAFEFRVPDIDTQNKIVGILSSYDDLIENNFNRIKLLEESAELIYKEWFVNLRFPGYEKCNIVNGIPEGWNKINIGNSTIFELIKDNIKNFSGEKIYYATADIDGIYIVNKGIKVTYDEKPSRAQKKPELYSVWFARMSNTYKVLGFNEKNKELVDTTILSSGFAGLRVLEKEYYPYVYSFIKSKHFNKLKDSYATGSTQVSLNNNSLSKIEYLEPSKDILKKYYEYTLNILHQIEILKKKNEALKEARDILIPRLISGEIEL